MFSRFILMFMAMGLSRSTTAQTLAAVAQAPDKAVALEQQDNLMLLKHKPLYFIYGNPDTKVQISFKAPIMRHVPFYFGYSQIIFWRLNQTSKPFEDATYNPEFFYRWAFDHPDLQPSVDIGAWEHNSNGKAGDVSRSFDRSYLKLNLSHEGARWVTKASAKASWTYNQDHGNRDIYQFISPFEFAFSFIQLYSGSFVDKSELAFRFFPGGKAGERWRTGGYEVGYSFRLGGLDLYPALYAQYYQGFAETLVNYDKHVRQFRVGISF